MNTQRAILSVSTTLAILTAATFTGQAAVGIIATGTFTDVPDAVSGFDYTVTVNNSSSSTASIGSFWYGWTPSGGDFLPSNPTVPVGPTGWSATLAPEEGKFSIQYVLQSGQGGSAIAPGSSGIFTFTSADSPVVLNGNDTSPAGPVGSSFVYTGGLFSSPSEGITITEAPEPSSLGLLTLGGIAFALFGWRKRFVRSA